MLQKAQQAIFHFFKNPSENIKYAEEFLSQEEEIILQLINDLDREVKIIQERRTRDGYFTRIALLGLSGLVASTMLFSMETVNGIPPDTWDKRAFEIIFGVLPSLGLLYFAGPKYWSACERNIQLSDLSFDLCARLDECFTSYDERLSDMKNNIGNLRNYLNSVLKDAEKKETRKFR
jgi:hypothetical protein